MNKISFSWASLEPTPKEPSGVQITDRTELLVQLGFLPRPEKDESEAAQKPTVATTSNTDAEFSEE